MRGFIRLCSTAFVVLGMVTMALAAAAGTLVFTAGAASNESLGAAAGLGVGILFVIVGFFAGASLTLVGGATFLLASIDERLERAAKRAVLTSPVPATPIGATSPASA